MFAAHVCGIRTPLKDVGSVGPHAGLVLSLTRRRGSLETKRPSVLVAIGAEKPELRLPTDEILRLLPDCAERRGVK
jgi:hypothetical protein